MTGWDELLAHLAEAPRENGSAALHQTAAWLVETLGASGVEAELVPFGAHPYALRLAGVIALAGGLLYLRMVLARRGGAALAVALAVPALLLAELEFQRPVFGWIGAQTQHHVVARMPAQRPEQRLIFAAHYDTKTDALDHVERAPVDLLAAPVIPAMGLGALALLLAPRVRRGRRALRGFAVLAAFAAVLYGIAAFTALSAGAFSRARSPGAIDDGASCAVLVRLAQALSAAPPLARTQVEVLLLSAEEVGVQGSWEYAARRFAAAPDLPTRVVNLEGLGLARHHAVLRSERFTLRAFAPDAALVALLDAVHREALGAPLATTPFGGATDARSFLAHGIAAATLVSRPPGDGVPRGLHSWRDERSRLDPAALDASLAYLLAVAGAADARGF
jgi:acetylornithine deacetylase/succinyl-diaminopimelate desuccinylase-like protein